MAMQTVKLLSYDDGGDAIDFLRRQHREIDQLLGALAEASPDERGDILVEAGDLLAVHMAVEERIFYPGLTPEANDGEHRSFVVLAVEDHFDVKRALGELLQTAVDDGAFAAMTSLPRRAHPARTRAPRNTSFPRIRRRLSPAPASAGSSTRCASSSSRSAPTPSRATSSSRTPCSPRPPERAPGAEP